MGKKNNHGTASRTTQIATVMSYIITAAATVIDAFSISDLINCLNQNGEKLTKYLYLVMRALIEGGEIRIIKFVKRLFPGNEYLKLISGEQEIVIDSCDGTELLSEATDTFASIDSDFKNYDANEKGSSTEATKVGVYELIKDSQFTDFFNSVGVGLDKLCLTQHQIKKFVQKHRNWLRKDGYATFFLFKSKRKFFVACVIVLDDGALSVSVCRLENDLLWDAQYRHRVVLPQLDTL